MNLELFFGVRNLGMIELVKDVCNRKEENERIWLKKEYKKYIVKCCIVILYFRMLVFLKV